MKLSPHVLRMIADSLEEIEKIESVTIAEIMINATLTVAVKKEVKMYYVTQIRQVGG